MYVAFFRSQTSTAAGNDSNVRPASGNSIISGSRVAAMVLRLLIVSPYRLILRGQ